MVPKENLGKRGPGVSHDEQEHQLPEHGQQRPCDSGYENKELLADVEEFYDADEAEESGDPHDGNRLHRAFILAMNPS